MACTHNPLTSIADDVAGANRLINAQDGPVLLVGHSGVIITEAGNNPKAVGLVYVAAFAPDEGETLASLAQPYGPTPVCGEIHPIDDGFLLLTQKGMTEYFAQDLSTEGKQTMVATQAPTQGAILTTPITRAAWHTKPSWFVMASNDHAISPEQEATTATRMGAKTLTRAASHVVMLSHPEEVADFIIEAAASLGAASTSPEEPALAVS